MENTNELREFYDKNKVKLDEIFEFKKCNLFNKIKHIHPDWNDDTIKFNIYIMTVYMMTYVSDDNNFASPINEESLFGLDEFI